MYGQFACSAPLQRAQHIALLNCAVQFRHSAVGEWRRRNAAKTVRLVAVVVLKLRTLRNTHAGEQTKIRREFSACSQSSRPAQWRRFNHASLCWQDTLIVPHCGTLHSAGACACGSALAQCSTLVPLSGLRSDLLFCS